MQTEVGCASLGRKLWVGAYEFQLVIFISETIQIANEIFSLSQKQAAKDHWMNQKEQKNLIKIITA